MIPGRSGSSLLIYPSPEVKPAKYAETGRSVGKNHVSGHEVGLDNPPPPKKKTAANTLTHTIAQQTTLDGEVAGKHDVSV